MCEFFNPGILGPNFKEGICKPIERYKRRPLDEEAQLDSEEAIRLLQGKIHRMITYCWNELSVKKHEVVICVNLRKGEDEKFGYVGFQYDMYKGLCKFIEEKNIDTQ